MYKSIFFYTSIYASASHAGDERVFRCSYSHTRGSQLTRHRVCCIGIQVSWRLIGCAVLVYKSADTSPGVLYWYTSQLTRHRVCCIGIQVSWHVTGCAALVYKIFEIKQGLRINVVNLDFVFIIKTIQRLLRAQMKIGEICSTINLCSILHMEL